MTVHQVNPLEHLTKQLTAIGRTAPHLRHGLQDSEAGLMRDAKDTLIGIARHMDIVRLPPPIAEDDLIPLPKDLLLNLDALVSLTKERMCPHGAWKNGHHT